MLYVTIMARSTKFPITPMLGTLPTLAWQIPRAGKALARSVVIHSLLRMVRCHCTLSFVAVLEAQLRVRGSATSAAIPTARTMSLARIVSRSRFNASFSALLGVGDGVLGSTVYGTFDSLDELYLSLLLVVCFWVCICVFLFFSITTASHDTHTVMHFLPALVEFGIRFCILIDMYCTHILFKVDSAHYQELLWILSDFLNKCSLSDSSRSSCQNSLNSSV